MTTTPNGDYYGHPSNPDPERPFWESRPILRHIHQCALARGVGPWTVLLNVLVNVTAHVAPGYTLPAIVGGRQPLNLIGIAVGGSGTSKDSSRAVANAAVVFADDVPVAPLGSAQGIPKTYQRYVPPKRALKGEPPEPGHIETITDRAIFTAMEVNSVGALAESSNTLRDTIKQAWTGSELGYAYAGDDKRNILKAHSYRFSMIVGAQPSESNWLMSGEADGFPQRLVWLPASNRYGPANPFEDRPIRSIIPEMPEPIIWQGINWHMPKPGEYIDFRLPESITEMIYRKVAEANLSINGSGMDGHRLQGIERVAIALACLDGRLDVTQDDWDTAETIYTKSDETREDIKRAIADKETERRSAVAFERAVVDANADNYRANYDQKRIDETCDKILGLIKDRPDGRMMSEVRRSITPGLRRYMDNAVETMEGDNLVHRRSYKAPNGRQFQNLVVGKAPD
ncbi:hypothetical protein O4160_07615 [Rhodococcus sp. IEGM 1401]|uniref:hypothetical protein n=1 Tax=unclassified Rhodococcus (in: high G+C Gram-positive bacteria) TaxID=192944 RepID=UPI0022B41B78|nr:MULTISPECIES: hypothetical protein [unclassified Rhodococcus (in: high G+C Gram-positive bacteria)]MCZ4560706.1 hypothetical protein [Rhodococcus sp. IEGM 1401]MDI9920834.1 hypothetical protein [Rhodococcus sp. IEGM 1372]MDV8033129.1 hypothetical protein [Rhodococcus sp. IEGM 1414]